MELLSRYLSTKSLSSCLRDIRKTDEDTTVSETCKDFLVLDALPTDATKLFLEDLRRKLKGIRLIPICEDALNIDTNVTKPVLVICNYITRIESDIRRIKDLPHHNGKVILLVLHCVKVEQLPKVSLRYTLELPTVSEIVEIGYDYQNSPHGIYHCTKNDEAIKILKEMDFEKSQSRCEVDLVVILRCAFVCEYGKMMIDTDTIKQASKLIRQTIDAKRTCLVVHCPGSCSDWKSNYSLNSDPDDRNDFSRGITNDGENGDFVTALNEFESQKCDLVLALIDQKLNAVQESLRMTPKQYEITKYELNCVLQLSKDGFVPVLHGKCSSDAYKGYTILDEATFVEGLKNNLVLHKVEYFPSRNYHSGKMSNPVANEELDAEANNILYDDHM